MTKAWGYSVATNILGMGNSSPLASASGLEPNLPTMSMKGGHKSRLERIEILLYTRILLVK